ncbi:hypothetical protein Taro_034565 [Colocasia esculenta]|uniref:RNase H type-1 domain-containing protein n=1 Tax=Colocasia esculenta TaxID=4460 RepID=A0A843W3A2_COLES|nr:hypothetical protein [Colocasia esculenta]
MEQYLEEKKASQKRSAPPFQWQDRKKVAYQSPQRLVAASSQQVIALVVGGALGFCFLFSMETPTLAKTDDGSLVGRRSYAQIIAASKPPPPVLIGVKPPSFTDAGEPVVFFSKEVEDEIGDGVSNEGLVLPGLPDQSTLTAPCESQRVLSTHVLGSYATSSGLHGDNMLHGVHGGQIMVVDGVAAKESPVIAPAEEEGNLGDYGGGGCIRDSQGNVHLAFAHFYGVGTSMLVETRALSDGLHFASTHGYRVSIVYSDS